MPSLPKTAMLLGVLADLDTDNVPESIRASLAAAKAAWLKLDSNERSLAVSDVLDAHLKAEGRRAATAEKPSATSARLTAESTARLGLVGGRE